MCRRGVSVSPFLSKWFSFVLFVVLFHSSLSCRGVLHKSRSRRWTSGYPRKLLALVLRLDSQRGEISYIFRKCQQQKNINSEGSFLTYTVRFRQSKTALFDCIFFRLESSSGRSYRQSSRFFIFFVLFLQAVGERSTAVQQSKSVGSSALHALSPRATARRTLVPGSWWLWA